MALSGPGSDRRRLWSWQMATKSEPCAHCGVRHRTLTAEQCEDRSMSEKTLSDRVVYRAKKYGWVGAHAGRGIVGERADGTPIFVTPMSAGWPDWTFAKPGHHLVFMELKREEGEVEPAQEAWLSVLNACGAYAI